MRKLKINYQTLTDIINIKYDIFNPIKKFLSKKDFYSVIEKKKLSNGKFFPFPIFFPLKRTDYKKLNNQKKIKFFMINIVCNLKINSFYFKNKKKIGKKIFKTSNLSHPGYKNFIDTGNYNIDCEIKKFNKKILKKVNFTNPNIIKKIIKKRKLKTVVGFHTRNVPHRAHEWIHSFGLKNCDGLLVHPMIGQFKKNEYKSNYIISSNEKLVDKIYKKKIFCLVFLILTPVMVDLGKQFFMPWSEKIMDAHIFWLEETMLVTRIFIKNMSLKIFANKMKKKLRLRS